MDGFVASAAATLAARGADDGDPGCVLKRILTTTRELGRRGHPPNTPSCSWQAWLPEAPIATHVSGQLHSALLCASAGNGGFDRAAAREDLIVPGALFRGIEGDR